MKPTKTQVNHQFWWMVHHLIIISSQASICLLCDSLPFYPEGSCSHVCRRHWLSCHVDHQEVSRCHTRGECVTHMPLPSANKAAHASLETERRHHQKFKTEASVAPQKGIMLSKYFLKKIIIINHKQDYCGYTIQHAGSHLYTGVKLQVWHEVSDLGCQLFSWTIKNLPLNKATYMFSVNYWMPHNWISFQH